MTDNFEALRRAKQALAHHDQFNDFGDDHALYVCPEIDLDGAMFELPCDQGVFTLADLRALVMVAAVTNQRFADFAAKAMGDGE